MQSRFAREVVEAAWQIVNARPRGEAISVTHMGGSRAAGLLVADSSRLPDELLTEDDELQDASGTFYFVAGYSRVGGPDVVKG